MEVQTCHAWRESDTCGYSRGDTLGSHAKDSTGLTDFGSTGYEWEEVFSYSALPRLYPRSNSNTSTVKPKILDALTFALYRKYGILCALSSTTRVPGSPRFSADP